MVFVICIGIVCRYFVGHGSYMLCEAWSLKIHEKYVWELHVDTLLDKDLIYIYIYISIYTLRDMEFKDV